MPVYSAQTAPLSNASGQVLAAGTQGVYRGYNLRETAGSAAVVELYDGSSTNGPLLATIALASSASVDISHVQDDGTIFNNGIWLQLVSGTLPKGFIRWARI